MATITDDYMKQMMATTKAYTVVILKKGKSFKMPDVYPTVWEHGRKNFSLRADGKLLIVCPVADETEVAGIGVFDAGVEETIAILNEDPAIKTNILTYEVHASRSFPGDLLK